MSCGFVEAHIERLCNFKARKAKSTRRINAAHGAAALSSQVICVRRCPPSTKCLASACSASLLQHRASSPVRSPAPLLRRASEPILSPSPLQRRVSSAMKLSLEEFLPTEEELEAAKKVVAAASGKQKHSKMEAMVGFVKRDVAMDAEAKQRVLAARGDARQQYLLKYVAYQTAKGTGTLQSRATHRSCTEAKTRFHYWNEHELRKAKGDDTAEAWMPLLDYRQDPVSKSTSEKLRQYIVPVEWVDKSEADEERLSLQGSKAAGKEEIANFESVDGVALPRGVRSTPASASTDPIPIKEEKKSPQEKAEEELTEFKNSASARWKQMAGTIASLQLLKGEALKDEMTGNIAEATSRLVQQHVVAQRGIEKIMKAKPEERNADDKNIKKLMTTVGKLDEKVKSLQEWSKRLGVKINGGGSGGSKRRRTE